MHIIKDKYYKYKYSTCTLLCDPILAKLCCFVKPCFRNKSFFERRNML